MNDYKRDIIQALIFMIFVIFLVLIIGASFSAKSGEPYSKKEAHKEIIKELKEIAAAVRER